MKRALAPNLITLILALTLAACGSLNPFQYAKTPLDKAHVALRSLEIVQTDLILPVVQDPAIPANVKTVLKTISHDATVAAEQLAGGVVEFEAARATLKAGETSNDRLRIATANLVAWTATLQARIASLKSAVKEIKHV